MTGSNALLLSWSQDVQVSDVFFMDISTFGTFLGTQFNAVHLLERDHSVTMEKYISLFFFFKKRKEKSNFLQSWWLYCT